MQKGKLLLVDDDVMVLKLYERYFGKHFDVRTAKSAEEALKVIESGFKFEVILSDQVMPGMTGSELLYKLSQTHTQSIRMLMTADTEPSIIIRVSAQSRAFIVLNKPIKELDLIQSVNIAFQHYRLKELNNELSYKLKKISSEVAEQPVKSEVPQSDFTKTMYQAFIKLGAFKGNYFVNHFEGVLKIANYFVQELKLPEKSHRDLFNIQLMYSIMMQTFPKRLAYTNPFQLEDADFEEYKQYASDFFKKVIDKYGEEKYAHFFEIWEHIDGSGFPKKLKDNISLESQIFQLANLYFHFIYHLPNESIIDRFYNPTFKYRYETAIEKMKQGQKYILAKTKWFNQDLFNIFRFAIKENHTEVMLPIRENREIPNLDYFFEFAKLVEELDETRESNRKNQFDIVNEGDQTFAVKTIPSNQLAVGMVINQSLVTNSNVTVAKMGTKISGTVLENILTLIDKKMLKDAEKIEVKIPLT